MRTVYPQPGYDEQDTQDLLASGTFVFADCYTVVLITGEVMRWTTAQQDVAVLPIGGDPVVRRYVSDGVLVQGLQFKIGIGVEVDEQTITMAYKDSDIVPDRGVSVAQALRRGDFDGASIIRDRFFATTWGAPWIGGVRLFAGRVGSLEGVGRTEGKVKVRSDLALLNIPMPRNLYGASCQHVLFDSGCKLVKADFAVQGEVESGSTESVIKWALAGATPSFSLGTIYLETSTGVTFSRTIRQATSTELILTYPLGFTPEVGDQFVAYPGCPRTLEACDTFGNRPNFKGFPFVPTAETAY